MKKQVIVVGLGRYGSSVAKALYEMGHDVLAVDRNEKAVQDIISDVTHAVQLDVINEAALRDLGVSNFDFAIIGMGSDIQSSVMATLLLKRMGVPMVIARAQNELHGSILEKIGADRVVYIENEMGVRVAHSLASRLVLDYLEIAPNYGISRVVPPDSFLGKTLDELNLAPKGKYGIRVLLIRRGNDVIVTPDRYEKVQKGDILVVSGKDEQLEGLRE